MNSHKVYLPKISFMRFIHSVDVTLFPRIIQLFVFVLFLDICKYIMLNIKKEHFFLHNLNYYFKRFVA